MADKVYGTTFKSMLEVMTYLYSTGADELTRVQRNGKCVLIQPAADAEGVYFQIRSLNAPDALSLADLMENIKRVAAKNGVRLDPSPNRWGVVSDRVKGADGGEFAGWSLDGTTGEFCLYMDGDVMPDDFGDVTDDARQWVKDLYKDLDRKAGYRRN